MGARHRPCGHRHADRRRAAVAGKRHQPARPGPEELHRAGVGLEADERLHHHPANAPHGRFGGVEVRVLHDGRAAFGSRHRHVRQALRRRPDLSRQAPRQLGPGAAFGRLRPRGRERGTRRHDVAHRVPVQRRATDWRRRAVDARHAHRHDATGNDAGRRRPGRAPRRRALPAPGRPARRPAVVRPPDSRHRRRLRRPRVRLGLRQDHRRARLQRLRLRIAPRPAAHHHLHARRQGQRERPGCLPRPRPLRRARGGAARPRSTGLPRQGRAAQACSADLRAHRPGRRADAHRPVVRGHDQARRRRHDDRRQGHRRGRDGRRQVPSGAMGQHLRPVDEQHPGLVHLAPALVGPPHSGLVRRRRRAVRGPQRSRSARPGRSRRLQRRL